PSLARLVLHARRMSKTENTPLTVAAFAEALSNTPFAIGIYNLLADINDPKRGGAALAAVSICNGFALPPQRGHAKEVLKWLLVVAASGVVGNRTDATIVDVWNWLETQVSNSM